MVARLVRDGLATSPKGKGTGKSKGKGSAKQGGKKTSKPNLKQKLWKGAKQEVASKEDLLTIKRTMLWFNKHGSLPQPLRISELMGPCKRLGKRRAMAALHDLETKRDEIADPTAWILGSAVKGKAVKPLDDEFALKLRRTISWYNANGNLQAPLNYRTVSVAVANTHPKKALGILKELGEKAAEIRDPTAWVCGQARWYVHEMQVKKLVSWYSKYGKLKGELHVDAAVKKLVRLDFNQVKLILKRLSEKKDEIQNPTAWVNTWAFKWAGGDKEKEERESARKVVKPEPKKRAKLELND